MSGAGDRAVDRDVAAMGPDQSGIRDIAVHDQAAAAGRRERPAIGHDIRAGIDDEGMETGRDDRAIVDERHLPSAELAGTGNRVVHIGEGDARNSTGDTILAAVGQYDLSAALERDAVLDEFQVRVVSNRIERDHSRVVDDTAQRQHGTVTDSHGPGVVRDRRLLEHEVARAE
jgi:hypothetical protein